MTIAEQFWARVQKTDNCWIWQGGKYRQGKYGRLHVGRKTKMAHRISYEIHVGQIPENKMLIHVCPNRLCVNPDHLSLVPKGPLIKRRDSIDLFWGRVEKSLEENGCWIWKSGKDKDGYGLFSYRTDAGGRTVRAHRFSYELTNGPIGNSRLLVCHNCPGGIDNPACVRPDHLWLGTNQDNVNDGKKKGQFATGDKHNFKLYPEKIPRGERSGKAKLTEILVRQMREEFISGKVTIPYLAKKYPVGESQIDKIIRRVAWKHI